MFEKEAEEYLKVQCKKRKEEYVIRMPEVYIADIPQAYKDGAEFGYNKAKAETALLSQHILDLQKDKGNLTDKVRELEQQIEKMKCCGNCDFVFRDGNCYYDKECKNKDHWKLRR